MDELARNWPRLRLKYLRDFYADRLGLSNLSLFSKRLRGDLSEGERKALESQEVLKPSRQNLTLKGDRTVRQFFQASGANIWHEIPAIAELLSRQLCVHEGWDAAEVSPTQKKIERFLKFGLPGPSDFFRETFAEVGRELTIEHTIAGLPDPTGLAKLRNPARDFLRGYWPTEFGVDWVVARDVAVETDIEAELFEKISRHRLVVFTAAAGEGKTTILMRLAIKLRQNKSRVIYSESPAPNQSFPALPHSTTQTFVLIDNADAALDYDDMLASMARGNYHVVFCARDYLWNRRPYAGLENAVPCQVQSLSDAEIENLAVRIIRHNATNKPVSKRDLISTLESAVSQGTDNHLLAVMITATHGEGFRSIVKKTLVAFEKNQQEWSLKYVVCGAFVNRISDGRVMPLPVSCFTSLAALHLGVLDNNGSISPKNRSKVSAEIRGIGGEIRRIQGPTVGYYLLRHPTIEEIALEHFYGLDILAAEPPEFADEFIEDLCTIQHTSLLPQLQSVNQFVPNANYGKSMLDGVAPVTTTTSAMFQKRMVNALFENFVKMLGHWEKEFVQAGHVYLNWLSYAIKTENIGSRDDAEAYTARWIFRTAFAQGIRDPRFLGAGLRFESAVNPGTFSDPEAFTARDIARTLWNEGHRSRNYLAAWVQLEVEQNPGDFDEPEPFTARHICRTQWAEEHRETGYLASWLDLEVKANPGEFVKPAPFTVRHICRELWLDGDRSADYLARWLELEAKDNPGDFEKPAPFTARHICRELWSERDRGAGYLARWLELEAKDNPGDFEEPAPFTARHICRALWAEKYREAGYLGRWLDLEAKDNPGDFDEPAEFTARHICRELWLDGDRSADYLARWLDLEAKDSPGDFEKPAPFTARHICRALWSDGDRSADYLARWLELEAKDNPGDVDEPADFTARHICRALWSDGDRNADYLWRWLDLELQDNPGDFKKPAPLTARQVCRELWAEGYREGGYLARWLEHEAKVSPGDFDEPADFTARHVCRTLWSDGDRTAEYLWSWLDLELEENPGDFKKPAPFTIRQVCRELWAEGYREAGYLARWLDLEAKDNPGDFKKPAPFTARHICRALWVEGSRDPSYIARWLDLESQVNRGDFDEPAEFTARHICRTLWTEHAAHAIYAVLIRWLNIETQEQPGDFENPGDFTARWIFRRLWDNYENGVHPSMPFLQWVSFEARENLGNRTDPEKYTARWVAQKCDKQPLVEPLEEWLALSGAEAGKDFYTYYVEKIKTGEIAPAAGISVSKPLQS